MKTNNHYLLHLPHSSTKIPQEYLKDYYLTLKELKDNILEYADLYTDELFQDIFKKYGGIKNEYSRLFFDPERFGDDRKEDMQKNFGLGWFYENAILQKKPLRSIENKHIIRKYYDAHHQKLNQLTQETLDIHDTCTLIDCHSFSNKRYWFHEDIKLPDICIGFEDLHVDKDLVEKILAMFSDYSIGINKPYCGSLVPTNYWGKDTRVKSVMIEINKKLYLEEDNITKNKNFDTIKEKINGLL